MGIDLRHRAAGNLPAAVCCHAVAGGPFGLAGAEPHSQGQSLAGARAGATGLGVIEHMTQLARGAGVVRIRLCF